METSEAREIVWASGTREALRGFPDQVRAVFGRALYKAQLSKLHRDASHMTGLLRGVTELAGDEGGDTYRLYYTLKCPRRVYLLFGHKKKSKHGIGIPKHQEDLIVQRYREAMLDCRHRPGQEP